MIEGFPRPTSGSRVALVVSNFLNAHDRPSNKARLCAWCKAAWTVRVEVDGPRVWKNGQEHQDSPLDWFADSVVMECCEGPP
jgi:hypothetical protein